ncbi:hypothetical protein GXM_00663 [Nostoc sphaeroides CCNUC1]|uniref:Uncharacterized protein n=1 Tax=Nostoc sphaeroides CCNUC1 TaxID=2653204 RepID=A0A5P8VS69_9NOSO|nr:hypothetical protein GXM_00663 [Nostoc sphaeroides CCNUC1]
MHTVYQNFNQNHLILDFNFWILDFESSIPNLKRSKCEFISKSCARIYTRSPISKLRKINLKSKII